MAFVNELITEEEEEDMLMSLQLPHPDRRSLWLGSGKRKWTIDRERGMTLIHCGHPIREDGQTESFSLLLRNFEKSSQINLRMERKKSTAQTEAGAHIVPWRVISMRIPKSLSDKHEEIINILEEALSVFAINGEPDRKFVVQAEITEGRSKWETYTLM